MFSCFVVFSEVCAAVAAYVSLDCELAEFPCFLGFNQLFLAVRAVSHDLIPQVPYGAINGFKTLYLSSMKG